MKNNKEQTGDAVNLTYSCRLSLSTTTVTYLADLLRSHLKAIGSRWRSRTPGQIAVLVPAVLRHDQRAADLDGALIRTRRRTGKANRKDYSGKHRSHGLLFLALTDERGNLIWISSARRGAAGEIKTARHDKICEHLRTAGLGALADLGFIGLNDDPVVITEAKPTRKQKLTARQKQTNQIIAAARAPSSTASPR